MSVLCRLGVHKWRPKLPWLGAGVVAQRCARCNRRRESRWYGWEYR